MSLFLLVEFLKGNRTAIVSCADIIDAKLHTSVNVNDNVVVRWEEGRYFDVKVLDKSDNYGSLDLKKRIIVGSKQTPQDDIHSVKRRKVTPSSGTDTSDDEEPMNSMGKMREHKSKGSEPRVNAETRTRELAKRCGFIEGNGNFGSDNGHIAMDAISIISFLQERVSELERRVFQLEKEKSEALEMANLVKLAKAMVDNLVEFSAAKKDFSSGSSNSSCENSRVKREAEEEQMPDPNVAIFTQAELGEHTGEEITDYMVDPAADQLQWRSTDANVVRLINDIEVYLPRDYLQRILITSKTASQMARSLAKVIFTETALSTCSVFGGMSKGPLGRRSEVRQGLNSNAIKAIIKFVLDRGLNERWTERQKDLVHTLGSMLSSTRAKYRIKDSPPPQKPPE